jgi:hypothetical protein
MMGGLYEAGYGVPQDRVQALMWFTLAESRLTDDKQREMAADRRVEVAAKMSSKQIAKAQQLAKEWHSK